MDKVLEDYKSIKNNLDDFNNQGGSDEDFVKLVSMNGVDDDLKQTLILLHSNYKAENKEQKTSIYKLLYKLIDQNIEVFNRINILIKEQEKEQIKNSNTNSGFLKMEGAHKIFLIIIAAVLVFFVLAFIDKHAFEIAYNAIKDIVTLGGGAAQPQALSPTQQ